MILYKPQILIIVSLSLRIIAGPWHPIPLVGSRSMSCDGAAVNYSLNLSLRGRGEAAFLSQSAADHCFWDITMSSGGNCESHPLHVFIYRHLVSFCVCDIHDEYVKRKVMCFICIVQAQQKSANGCTRVANLYMHNTITRVMYTSGGRTFASSLGLASEVSSPHTVCTCCTIPLKSSCPDLRSLFTTRMCMLFLTKL